MTSHQPTGDPHVLAGPRVAFIDWSYVRPADYAWATSGIDRLGLDATVDDSEVSKPRRRDDPWGLKLVKHAGVAVGPLISPSRPWEEGGLALNSVILDGGIYRAWATTGWYALRRGGDHIAYFESNDGFEWRPTRAGVVAVDGDRDNNLVALRATAGSVFVDPSSDTERYKWISEDEITRDDWDWFEASHPGERDPRAFRGPDRIYGMRGATSGDGIHWTYLDRPLAAIHTDSQVVAYFDAVRSRYVAYTREWTTHPQAPGFASDHPQRWMKIGRRAIGRTESTEFGHFPPSSIVLEASWAADPSDVLYTNCRTTIPGAPEAQVMFPMIWNTGRDATSLDLAVSSDGMSWRHTGGDPIFRAQPGSWYGGAVFGHPDLIELPNGDFALPFTGYDVPHKYPRTRAYRGPGYVIWPHGRLAGIHAHEEGGFTTAAFIARGTKLSMNGVTARAGWIRVEAARLDGSPIEGRTLREAVAFTGDDPKWAVRWAGHDELGIEPGEPVVLRLQMSRATVYSLDWA